MIDDKPLWQALRAAAGVPESAYVLHAPVPPGDFGEARPRPPDFEPYLLEKDLATAAEIAIRLRQPLLLTGDPGTGKTRFARALAHQLCVPLLICNIRSTSTTADLFYSIDDLARFRDAQMKTRDVLPPVEHYMTFNGLGRAILFAGGPDAPLKRVRNRLADARCDEAAPPDALGSFSRLYPRQGFPSDGLARVVVLLDEFDKAPRDTPNDMLNELAEMAFEIPELGVRAEAPKDMRPIVVITSNSERSLPDPFLRRCLYHDIQFPTDPERLRLIVWSHIKSFEKAKSQLLDDALARFTRIRGINKLTRRPGTAELLDWLRALTSKAIGLGLNDSLDDEKNADQVRRSLVAITKARDDRPLIEDAVLARRKA